MGTLPNTNTSLKIQRMAQLSAWLGKRNGRSDEMALTL
jgi:hypothetical protein